VCHAPNDKVCVEMCCLKKSKKLHRCKWVVEVDGKSLVMEFNRSSHFSRKMTDFTERRGHEIVNWVDPTHGICLYSSVKILLSINGRTFSALTLLVGGSKGIWPVKNMGGWWMWALVSPDGVAPSRMVGVPACVNLPLHHKVQKFSSGICSPGWSRKKGCKTVVVV